MVCGLWIGAVSPRFVTLWVTVTEAVVFRGVAPVIVNARAVVAAAIFAGTWRWGWSWLWGRTSTRPPESCMVQTPVNTILLNARVDAVKVVAVLFVCKFEVPKLNTSFVGGSDVQMSKLSSVSAALIVVIESVATNHEAVVLVPIMIAMSVTVNIVHLVFQSAAT